MTQMAREIAEQPATIAATVDALLPELAGVRELASDCRSVTFYARGSSDTAAVYGRYLCEITAGIPCGLGAPSVATLYDTRPNLHGTLAVILSQSGHTEEMVDVARWARRQGARTVGITNASPSPLAAAVDVPLITRAGEELAVPATKTHTAQLVAVAILAAALARDADEFIGALGDVAAEAQRMLAGTATIERAAGALAGARALIVTGRAFTMATALEVALKMQETCGLAALGLSAADLQHGPSALERADVPMLIAAAPGGPTLGTLRACATTARKRGSVVVAIGGDTRLQAACDIAIDGPQLPESLAPIVTVIPGQLLVEALARRRGIEPDDPPGLSKVTQTTQ